MTAGPRRSTRPGRTVIDEIVVVIPANDEEALLGSCLTALGSAISARAEFATPALRVVLVLDACVDGSAAVADGFAWVDVVTTEVHSVGSARTRGVAHALASSAHPPDRIWIANTDADSRVPPGWVDEHIAAATAGLDALIGSVRPDPADLTAAQYLAWEERHSNTAHTERIHGANLGVRADAYLEAGGFAPVREHEDLMLVEELRSCGALVAASPTCWVQTSARTVGRTPGGFASFVRAHY